VNAFPRWYLSDDSRFVISWRSNSSGIEGGELVDG